MSDILYQGHGWDIRMDEGRTKDGRVVTRARAHICDTVHIVASPKPGHVFLLKEWRPYYQKHVWMIPSGKMDKEKDPAVAAQRELQEETGCRAGVLKPFVTVRHAEHIDYVCHIYTATDLVPDPLNQDDDESIELHEIALGDAIDLVLQSDPIHTVTALALLRYQREYS